MRILLVSNGTYKSPGRHYYDVWAKLRNGFIRSGHTVQFYSDRDMARLGSWFGSSRSPGALRRCNEQLVNAARNFRPDFILLSHVDLIELETLLEIRRILPDVRIAQHNGDIVHWPRFPSRIMKCMPALDATFITTAGPVLKRFHHARGVVCYVPNPVDPSIEWPRTHERDDQPNDVFYALRGLGGSYPGDQRLEIPGYLHDHVPEIKMDYHGMRGREPLFGAAYYDAIANARMGLNLNVTRLGVDKPPLPEEMYLYSSDRLSQYVGSGLLVFSPRLHALHELFPENEMMIFYDSREELAEKVRYYKRNPKERMRVAGNAWAKAHAEFSERKVAQYMLEISFKKPLSQSYAWSQEQY